jgi:iron(III) transport system substrate-binding protein
MKDATPLIPRAITVTKHAASPAAAQLFLDFLYTQAGRTRCVQAASKRP